MAAHTRISIVGAGIGGLVLGRCLKARGIPAILWDSAPASRRQSYSITLLPWAYDLLLKDLSLDHATFYKRVAVDYKRQDSNDQQHIGAPFRAHRGELEGLLAEGLDIRWSHKLTKVQKDTHQNTLSFEDGKHFTSDIVIGADGVHSQVRKSIAPNSQVKVHPYVVYNGKRRIDPANFEQLASQFRNVISVQTRHGDAFLQAYVNEYKDEYVSLSYTYSRPSRELSDPLDQRDRSVSGASKIPEALFDEVDHMAGLEEPFATVFDSRAMRDDRVLHWLMRSVTVNAEELADAASKGIALIGDALHGTPILGSEGANLAIRDSVELADCIAQSSSLTTYFNDRGHRWSAAVEDSETRLAGIHAVEKASL